MTQCMGSSKAQHPFAFTIFFVPWKKIRHLAIFGIFSFCGIFQKIPRHHTLEPFSKRRRWLTTKTTRKSVAKPVNVWLCFLWWGILCILLPTHRNTSPKLAQPCWPWPIWLIKFKMVIWQTSSAETLLRKLQKMPQQLSSKLGQTYHWLRNGIGNSTWATPTKDLGGWRHALPMKGSTSQ